MELKFKIWNLSKLTISKIGPQNFILLVFDVIVWYRFLRTRKTK